LWTGDGDRVGGLPREFGGLRLCSRAT
jgi:hypothetical protein